MSIHSGSTKTTSPRKRTEFTPKEQEELDDLKKRL
jgi:hypothetical protein